jgi:hypothetical protein
MPENRRKRPRDPAQLAKLMIDIASGEVEDREPTPEEQGKDPAAVSLGRKGGLKGGKVRAEKLSPEQRRESARRAVRARWGKDRKS